MHNLHGGAIKKNPGKHGFVPIRDMLENSTATLELLSDDSSYGFIVELTVHADHSEYTTIDDQPITSFILKIVVTSPEKNSILLTYKDDKPKRTESVSNFVNEAKVQQQIWLQSIQHRNPEICPDVLDVFFFDYTNSKHLIRLFETVTLDENIKFSMLRYLNNIFNKSNIYGLGLMVMPKVINSITLYSYLSKYPRNSAVYSNIIAQIVRLFMINGIIHLDLHNDNILINTDNLYCEIIDFGIILQLQPDEYHMYRSRYEQLNDDAQKSEFMKDILNHISVSEVSEVQRQFQKNQSNIRWLIDYADKNTNTYLLAYQKIFEFIMPPLQLPPSPRQKKTKRKTESPTKSTTTKYYKFDPTKVDTIIPVISDIDHDTRIKTLTIIQKQKEAKEEIEKQRIFDENQRRWIETQKIRDEKQRIWDKTHPKLSRNMEEDDTPSVNPYECKTDENSGWCAISGGKIKSKKGKTTKKKHIKKKNKTYKKQKQK